MNNSVAITGIGAITPFGKDVRALLQGLKEGISCGKRLDRVESSDGYYPLELEQGTKIGAPVLDVPDYNLLGKRKKNRLTRADRFVLLAAYEALNNAGISLKKLDSDQFKPESLSSERIGVLVGSHFGGIQSFEENYQRFLTGGPRKVSPLTVPGIMPNRAAGEVSEVFGLKGPSFSPVAASASSAYSLAIGIDMIRTGRADVILAGGTEAVLTPFILASFSNLRATTKQNNSPKTACRPFDADRDGFLPAEGAGIVVLESKNHAQRRDADYNVKFSGAGMNDDAHHLTDPEPEGKGASDCMKLALDDSGLDPGEVDYLNAHGTSTPKNDPIETRAIKSTFAEDVDSLSISSTKSQMGHLLGADGVVESIATILALREGFVPPTINYENTDPECDLNYTPNDPVKKKLEVAMTNSYGFGGHNAALCFKKAEKS